MIDSNSTIFRKLDEHCSNNGAPLSNAGKPRWIKSQPVDRNFMIQADVVQFTQLSPSRKLAILQHHKRYYVAAMGFDSSLVLDGTEEVEVSAAHATVCLAEFNIRPRASVSQIRDAIEAFDMAADPLYNGHDLDQILSLFPSLQILHFVSEPPNHHWNFFFNVCLEECRLYTSWLSEELIETLKVISALDPAKIPYRILCRSIFDGDPGSFFLALYRCLERIYSFSSARDLSQALNIDAPWEKIASALESKIGWYPREEQSLEQLMRLANTHDLEKIVSLITQSQTTHLSIHASAARWIYRLRNSLVHYRPHQDEFPLDRLDWDSICLHLAGIVLDTYNSVFEETSLA